MASPVILLLLAMALSGAWGNWNQFGDCKYACHSDGTCSLEFVHDENARNAGCRPCRVACGDKNGWIDSDNNW